MTICAAHISGYGRILPANRAADESGVALLAVLWLSVALAFIAMATAQMVRTEVEAVSNQIEWQRDYYLARGGIEAAVYTIARYNPAPPPGTDFNDPSVFAPGKRWLQFQFPGGASMVELVPENAKLNINLAPPEQLATLFAAVGAPAADSLSLAAAIAEWRSPRLSEAGTALDLFYAALPQPYPARHAPLEQLEDLLPVRGMSRDLFFGNYRKTSEGGWKKSPALADLLTTQPSAGAVNPNFAAYEVLRSLPGWSDSLAARVVAARTIAPFRTMDDLQTSAPDVSPLLATSSLTLAQGPVYTLTATGISPGSGVRRSLRALVVIDVRRPLYHQVLGWWDDWPSPSDLPATAGSADQNGNQNQL